MTFSTQNQLWHIISSKQIVFTIGRWIKNLISSSKGPMYNEVKTHYNVPINYDPTRIKFVYPLSEIVFHDGDTAYLQTSLNFASQCESYIIEKRYFIRSCPKSLCAAPHDYQTYFHDRFLLYCRLRISIKVGKNITWDVLL